MIGVVAEMLKLHPQTLRMYEKKGLIRPSRSVGKTRMYSAEDVEEIARVTRLARDLGVNLAGIEIILKMRRRMLDMQAQIEGLMNHVRSDMAPGPRRRCATRRRGARAGGLEPARAARPVLSPAEPERTLIPWLTTTSVTLPIATEAGRLPLSLALLPLRDTVLFPQSILPLAAGRAASLKLIEEAARGDRTIGVITQRDPAAEEPRRADLHRIGTVATIHKVVKQPDGTLRLVVQGLRRFRILELTQTRPYLLARVEEMDEVAAAGDLETEALVRNATTLFRQIVELSPLLPDELAGAVQNVTEPGRLADVIAASLPALSTAVKQELLETADVKARLQRLVATLTKEIEVLELGSKIQSQVESEMGKGQREYYLREQLKAIQKELGQTDDRTRELDELREKIEAAQMTEEAKKEALRELDRLGKMPPAAAEYTVARTYLDWLIALPWSKETTDTARPRRGARPSSTRTTRGSRRSRTGSSSTSP